MSILLYTGLPGSGKSYSAVENIIIPTLREGRTLVTNVPLVNSEIYDDFPEANILRIPHDLKSDQVETYFRMTNFPPGSVFVIDECSVFFPSGQKQNNVPQTVIEFFTKHRHSVSHQGFSSEIILMTQHADQCSSWLRKLVESQYVHYKRDKEGLKNSFSVRMYAGAHTGNDIPERHLVKKLTGKYKPEIYRYYKSHTLNATDFESGMEQKVDDRANHKGLYVKVALMAIAAIVCMFLAIKLVLSLFLPEDIIEVDQAKEVDQEKIQPVDPRLIEPSTPAELIAREVPNYSPDPVLDIDESEDWKFTGTIKSGRKMVALLASAKGTYQVDLRRYCGYRQSISDYVCFINNKLVTVVTGPTFDDEYVEQEYDPFGFSEDDEDE